MIPLAFVVALAGASLVVVVVAIVSLAKQTTRLASSLAEFQGEMQPILEAIRGDADRAASHLKRLRMEEAAPRGDAPEADAPG